MISLPDITNLLININYQFIIILVGGNPFKPRACVVVMKLDKDDYNWKSNPGPLEANTLTLTNEPELMN